MQKGITLMKINTEYIKLEQFLKLVEAAQSGGEAKHMIQDGQVQVNGETEIRRGKKLRPGDEVLVNGKTYKVE